MAQYLIELCTLLVEDALGAFFAHLFSTLATSGRLAATQLAQKCHLPLRQIRHGLSVLTQAQLIYHHTSSDSRTSYEVNLRNAYNIIRSGKIAHLVREKLGDDAALLVIHLLVVGQSRIKDLSSYWKSQTFIHRALYNGDGSHIQGRDSRSPSDGVQEAVHQSNGIQRGQTELDVILKQLVQHGVVLRVNPTHFHTFDDNYLDAESRILALENVSATKGKKAQEGLDGKVRQEMEAQEDASVPVVQLVNGNKSNLKRPALDGNDTSVKKKTKITNSSNTDASRTARDGIGVRNDFAENIVIRVNHDKVAAILRNDRLIDAAQKRLGRPAAQIYTAVLEQFAKSPYRSQTRMEPRPEDEDNEAFDLDAFEIDLDSLLMAVNTQDRYMAHGIGNSVSIREVSHIHVNGHINGNHAVDNAPVTLSDIKATFLTLAQEPHKFVAQDSNSLRWIVDFPQLSKHLRREEALRLAGSRLNNVALRLIRVLLDKGKLDEKFLQEVSLLGAKDLRQCLAKLKTLGFLGLQEVPREPQRQPNRTMFLWFYDSDQVRKLLLADLYKCMARLLRRLKAERDMIGAVLDKAERTDVKGNEEKLLSSGETKVLRQWRRKEEWLLVELERLDDSVIILRDI